MSQYTPTQNNNKKEKKKKKENTSIGQPIYEYFIASLFIMVKIGIIQISVN
jgi:hypothetical protein